MTANLEIMHLHNLIDGMIETTTHLEEKRDLVKSRYEQLDGTCQALHQALDALQKELDRSAPGSTGFDIPAAVDLSDCKSHRERLVRIAIANGGQLNIPAARDIILSAGASKADPHHLGSNILRLVKRNAQDWECVGPRIYRYKPFEDKGNEEP